MGNFMTDSVLMPSRQYMQGLNNQQYINPMTMSLNQYVFEQQLMHQQAVQMQQIQQQQQSLNLGYELQQLYPRIPHNQNDFHKKLPLLGQVRLFTLQQNVLRCCLIFQTCPITKKFLFLQYHSYQILRLPASSTNSLNQYGEFFKKLPKTKRY